MRLESGLGSSSTNSGGAGLGSSSRLAALRAAAGSLLLRVEPHVTVWNTSGFPLLLLQPSALQPPPSTGAAAAAAAAAVATAGGGGGHHADGARSFSAAEPHLQSAHAERSAASVPGGPTPMLGSDASGGAFVTPPPPALTLALAPAGAIGWGVRTKRTNAALRGSPPARNTACLEPHMPLHMTTHCLQYGTGITAAAAGRADDAEPAGGAPTPAEGASVPLHWAAAAAERRHFCLALPAVPGVSDAALRGLHPSVLWSDPITFNPESCVGGTAGASSVSAGAGGGGGGAGAAAAATAAAAAAAAAGGWVQEGQVALPVCCVGRPGTMAADEAAGRRARLAVRQLLAAVATLGTGAGGGGGGISAAGAAGALEALAATAETSVVRLVRQTEVGLVVSVSTAAAHVPMLGGCTAAAIPLSMAEACRHSTRMHCLHPYTHPPIHPSAHPHTHTPTHPPIHTSAHPPNLRSCWRCC